MHHIKPIIYGWLGTDLIYLSINLTRYQSLLCGEVPRSQKKKMMKCFFYDGKYKRKTNDINKQSQSLSFQLRTFLSELSSGLNFQIECEMEEEVVK